MVVGNADSKCKGTITREKRKLDKVEKSVIDYYIFCDRMAEYFDEMVVDEGKEMVLRHNVRKKNNNEYTTSDHNILSCKFSLKFAKTKEFVRKEYFNFKSADCRLAFFKETNNTNQLSSCFNKPGASFDGSYKALYKQLNKKVSQVLSED